MSAVTLQIASPILDPKCSDKLKIEAQYIPATATILNPVHGRSAQTLQVFEWLNIYNGKSIFHAHTSFFQVILLILKASSINLAVLSPGRQW